MVMIFYRTGGAGPSSQGMRSMTDDVCVCVRVWVAQEARGVQGGRRGAKPMALGG